MATENIVKLDVGGTVFKTSKSTLTKFNGFFKTMLETGIPITKDESGAIFIDRDPAHFRLILNFMRDADVDLQKYSEDVMEIQNEAQFYGLEELVKMCSIEIENRRAGSFVKLNVGGTIFETAKSTLTKFDGFFKTMLESDILMTMDATGAILIDRSPKYFNRILTFMRDGDVELPASSDDVAEIQKEAEYYLLVDLVKLCEFKLHIPFDSTKKIEVNVGGTIFCTTVATLKKLGPKFRQFTTGGDVPTSIFIDRSPKHFEFFLNLARTAYKGALPDKLEELEELENEAFYYSIDVIRYSCSEKSRKIRLDMRGY